ncbi:Non-histone chromosomal protein 6 [Coemansia sp. RSA 2559]|nr:Non-histone chromosomal protein 6 [Coemansia sp. RSA 2559]KAJ2842006.1 Non-histone chromosomal protein 6 [Coemansia erecta]
MARKTASKSDGPVAAPTKASKKAAAAHVDSGRVKKTRGEKVTKRDKRAKKDPNAPKRALSAYMFFSQANRATVREQNPDVSFGAIGKLLGEKWKKLNDNDKKPYLKQAEDDKTRYAKEKAEWDAESSS